MIKKKKTCQKVRCVFRQILQGQYQPLLASNATFRTKCLIGQHVADQFICSNKPGLTMTDFDQLL